MSETNDCVCITKNLLKLPVITNFKCVHCCHGNKSRKDHRIYKIINNVFVSESIASRIKTFLTKLIDSDQTGFM